MEEAEQIVNDARRILPRSISNWFVSEFRELLRVPTVQDWHIRSLKIFKVILACDSLTRRLFRFFKIEWGTMNWDLNFLENVYKHLDTLTFRRFFSKMLEFAVLGHKNNQRLIVGYNLLGIVKEREKMHRWECQISGNAFHVRFYEKFRFLFRLYLTLDLSKFEQLLYMIKEHKSRGAPRNECEIERFKNTALEFFEGSEILTHELLDFCKSDEVKPYFVIFDSQNHPIPHTRSQNNHTTDSMNSVGQGIQDIQIPNPISVIPTGHNYPVPSASTQDNPTTVPIGKNHSDPNHSTTHNQKLDSANTLGQDIRIPEQTVPILGIAVEHNHSVQCSSTLNNSNTFPVGNDNHFSNFLTPHNPKPDSVNKVVPGQSYSFRGLRIPEDSVSVVPLRHNPFQGVSTLYNPTTFLVGKDHPFLDLSTPDNTKPESSTSVGHEHSVQGIRIQEHPTPVPAVPVTKNYSVQLPSTPEYPYKESNSVLDLRNPGYKFPVTPVEPSYSVSDPQTSKHSTPIGSSFSTRDLLGPLVTTDPDLNDRTVLSNQLLDSENPLEANRAIMETHISVPAESFGTSGMIPEARTRYRSTQDLNYQPLYKADSHMQDGTAPSLGSAIKIGSSFSLRDILGPLVTAEPDMNNRTLPSNQLLGSAIPVEANRANTEAPISAPAKSLGTRAVIPEARTKHCRAENLKMLFPEPVTNLNWLATNLVPEKKREADTDR